MCLVNLVFFVTIQCFFSYFVNLLDYSVKNDVLAFLEVKADLDVSSFLLTEQHEELVPILLTLFHQNLDDVGLVTWYRGILGRAKCSEQAQQTRCFQAPLTARDEVIDDLSVEFVFQY